MINGRKSSGIAAEKKHRLAGWLQLREEREMMRPSVPLPAKPIITVRLNEVGTSSAYITGF